MSDLDYYSYKALIAPDKPVGLVGLPASGHGQTARMVSIYTGLPLFWLDRAVEHKAGMAIDGVVLKGGDALRHSYEQQLLVPVLERSTAHILALGDTTLRDPDLRALLTERCELVFVRRPQEVLLATMARQFSKDPRAFYRYLMGRPPDPTLVGGELTQLDRQLAGWVDHVVDAGDDHVQHVADAVIAALGWELPELR